MTHQAPPDLVPVAYHPLLACAASVMVATSLLHELAKPRPTAKPWSWLFFFPRSLLTGQAFPNHTLQNGISLPRTLLPLPYLIFVAPNTI